MCSSLHIADSSVIGHDIAIDAVDKIIMTMLQYTVVIPYDDVAAQLDDVRMSLHKSLPSGFHGSWVMPALSTSPHASMQLARRLLTYGNICCAIACCCPFTVSH